MTPKLNCVIDQYLRRRALLGLHYINMGVPLLPYYDQQRKEPAKFQTATLTHSAPYVLIQKGDPDCRNSNTSSLLRAHVPYLSTQHSRGPVRAGGHADLIAGVLARRQDVRVSNPISFGESTSRCFSRCFIRSHLASGEFCHQACYSFVMSDEPVTSRNARAYYTPPN